ncbi:MAG TPA: DUF2905 domain-containing protein [Candidatus Hypogeohydataceae bacterium YC40]
MVDFHPLGKLFIFLGIFFVLLGTFFVVGGKIPLVGKLPGDIYIKRENFTFYFPLVSCALLSIILTHLMWLIGGLFRK